MSLRWTLDPGPDGLVVRLSGHITEEADLGGLLASLDGTSVHFNLADISMINSWGVRDWIRFVARLREADYTVTFSDVSPAMVRQMNLIADFCGSYAVRSVQLPYFCDACGTEFHQVLGLDDKAHATVEETLPCPNCGESAEFDDIADRYLAFSTRR